MGTELCCKHVTILKTCGRQRVGGSIKVTDALLIDREASEAWVFVVL